MCRFFTSHQLRLFACFFNPLLSPFSLHQVMGTSDQWVRFGPVFTRGAFSRQLIDSCVSRSPPSAWHSLRHLPSLWRKNITEGSDASPPHTSQPDSPSTSPPLHLPKRERTAATMVLSQRQRDELWVPGCKYVGVQAHYTCKQEQTCRRAHMQCSWRGALACF